MDEQAVFLGPDGELAVVLVDAQPADRLDPVTQTADVAAARRLVGQRSVVAAEFERVLRRLGAASRRRHSMVSEWSTCGQWWSTRGH